MDAFKKIILISFVLMAGINPACFAYERIWGSAEYLYWWPQKSSVKVPLITSNQNPAAFGFIDEPGTKILFGSGSSRNAFHFGGMSGGRITIGGWIDPCSRYGIEASAFALPHKNQSFRASSINTNIAILNIPFFSTQSGRENVLVNRLPNTATVRDSFLTNGFEINGLYQLHCKTNFPIVLLTGFRYLKINEKFNLNDAIIHIPSFPNSVVNVRDNFATQNHFYGLQFGAKTHFDCRALFFDISAAMALGRNHQTLKVSGQTNADDSFVVQKFGLFSEPTNLGTHKNNVFAVVPELKIKMGYDLHRNIRPFVTYDAFYINNIIRPGREIDRNINLSQNPLIGGTGVLSGRAAPMPKFKKTSMWIQGVSLGVDVSC